MSASNIQVQDADPPAHKTIDGEEESPSTETDRSNMRGLVQNEANPKPAPDDEHKSIFVTADEREQTKTSLQYDTANKPFFYHQKSSSGSSQFLLHPSSIQHQHRPHYENYGTTLLLILVLHIIYVYQWNKRYSKQDLCTNYDEIVEKKQYYRAVIAVMSHPPIDGGEIGGSIPTTVVGSSDIDASITNANDGSAATATTGVSRFIPCLAFVRRFCHSARRIKQHYLDRLLQPLISGSFSGLPLLAFCSHILWQCRALEELYVEYGGSLVGHVIDDSDGIEAIGTSAINVVTSAKDASLLTTKHHDTAKHAYIRVLVTLTLTALLLELKYLRDVLRRLGSTLDYDNSSNSPRNVLKRRPIVSLCSLCAALLTVHDSHFPFAQIPLLPFLRFPFLANSGFNKTLMILMLSVLCHRVHPVTSVISGVLSGALWSLKITSFLGTRYWGDLMLWSLSIVIVLSLKSNTNYAWLSTAVPCLDYVGWNKDGEVVSSTSSSTGFQGGRNTPIDLELGDTGTDQVPLLSHTSTLSGNSTIRGRIPR